MEALMFLLDSVIMVAMVIWGLTDDKRPKGSASSSLFRYRLTATAKRPRDAAASRVGGRR